MIAFTVPFFNHRKVRYTFAMEQQYNHESEEAASNAPMDISKKPLIGIPAAIITGAVIIALSVIFTLGKQAPTQVAKQGTPAQQPETPTSIPSDIAQIRPNDYVRGNAQTAKIVLIEYADTDCVFCERYHPTLLQLSKEYGDKLAIVYRHFPLTMLHPNAYTEALALECVGKLGGADNFNKYLDTIIAVTLNADAKSNEQLTTYATAQGINAAQFKTCIADPATSQKIDASIAEAQKIGAQGTPFSVAVNVKTGKQVIIPGAYPYDDVKKDIDSLLK